MAALEAEAESIGRARECRAARSRGPPQTRGTTLARRRVRTGLGVLARTYRDRMAGAFDGDGGAAAGSRGPWGGEGAISLVNEAAASLQRNPNETLLVEALLVAPGSGGRLSTGTLCPGAGSREVTAGLL